jgi:hypothetical protein
MEIVVVLVVWNNDAKSNVRGMQKDGKFEGTMALGLCSLRLQGRNTAASTASTGKTRPPAGR